MSTFYITCAIDYPNSPPHLGTAYEKIAADAIARYQRLAGSEVRFLMGLDEHSQNVEQRALERGLKPLAYCDRMASVFSDTWRALRVENNAFIRTSEARHKRSVVEMLRRIHESGDIYTGVYVGWYCVGCEAYYLERDLVDGNCPQHLSKPDWREEKNAFFRLSRYTMPLLEHMQAHPEFVRPEARRNEVLAVLNEGLEDISISRRGSEWGIAMPGHPGQVVYVWFDALTNYITDLGFPDTTGEFEHYWPAGIHLVGKDITRFHSLIWPAMLMSAGLDLPTMVFGHGFVQRGGGRMSKTIGNVIDPIDAARDVGIDALRYFLLREVPFGRDLDFDLDRLQQRYNAELANDLGNLLQRTVSMARKYRECVLRCPIKSRTVLASEAAGALDQYAAAFADYDVQGALKATWKLIGAANLAIENEKPWVLASGGDEVGLDAVLAEVWLVLRQIAWMIWPVMPERAETLARQLGVDADGSSWRFSHLEEKVVWPQRLQPGEPLFPRLE